MTMERQWPRTAAAEQPKLTTTTAATVRSIVGFAECELRATHIAGQGEVE